MATLEQLFLDLTEADEPHAAALAEPLPAEAVA